MKDTKKDQKTDKRPLLTKDISLRDFKDFYWLKEELVQFCRREGIKRSGGKMEIANRIEYYLRTGMEQFETSKHKKKPKSKFDWKNANLVTETIITDNYKNTENVRAFLKDRIGPQFKFSVRLMNWIKTNEGKTLQDVIDQWYILKKENKERSLPKSIAPQFEYNTYLRDFLADNPDRSRQDGIELWKIKRTKRGNNVYKKSDLNELTKN